MVKKLIILITLPVVLVSCASSNNDVKANIERLNQEVALLNENVEELKAENEDIKTVISFMTDDLNNVWEHVEVIEGTGKKAPSKSTLQLKEDYADAIRAYKNKKYAECRKELENIIQADPNNKLMGNLLYWIAETYYAENNMTEALKNFKEVIKLNKTKVPDAMLKAGYSQYNLKKTKEAKATLNSLIKKYPKSSAAKLAKNKLKKMS